MPKAAAHEQFDRFPEAHKLSGRAFGFTAAAALALLAASPLRHGEGPRWWAVGASAVFLVAAIFRAPVLQPLSIFWARVLRPVNLALTWIAMGLLFALVIVPVGLARHLLVQDPLNTRWDAKAATYWRARGTPAGSMSNQF